MTCSLTKEISKRVDEAIVSAEAKKIRPYLGLSDIGEECLRKAFYSWRFAKPEVFTARMYRLFGRGHREEVVVVDLLRQAGYKCVVFIPDTQEQFEVSLFYGHVKGHCDGFILINNKWYILEIKTASNKSFVKFRRAGSLKVANERYYIQTQSYIQEFGVEGALQIIVNKDNDDIYYEIVEKDTEASKEAYDRILELLTTTIIPKRLSVDPTYWKCSYCWYKELCHYTEKPRRTCRLCQHVKLEKNGTWTCEDYDCIPLTEQLNGCAKFKLMEG